MSALAYSDPLDGTLAILGTETRNLGKDSWAFSMGVRIVLFFGRRFMLLVTAKIDTYELIK